MTFERAVDLPSYESPPVNEVAVGIGFNALACWDSIAPGEYRTLIRDKYPKTEEKPPLFPLPPSLDSDLEMRIRDLPPIRRTWFLSEDERTLVQVQQDRIHVNWRRVDEADTYPRYDHVLNEFAYALGMLERFAAARDCSIQATAGEVTYVNHIPEGDLWTDWSDLTSVFADWVPVPCSLTNAASVSTSIAVAASENGGMVSPGHSMSLELRSAVRTGDSARLLVFQLMNRGSLDSGDMETVSEWCGRASEDIVRAFTCLTAPKAHELWRRTR